MPDSWWVPEHTSSFRLIPHTKRGTIHRQGQSQATSGPPRGPGESLRMMSKNEWRLGKPGARTCRMSQGWKAGRGERRGPGASGKFSQGPVLGTATCVTLNVQPNNSQDIFCSLVPLFTLPLSPAVNKKSSCIALRIQAHGTKLS